MPLYAQYSNNLGSLHDEGFHSMSLYQSLFLQSLITAWWRTPINATVSITIPTLGSLLDNGLQSMPLYQSLFQHSGITAWWGFSINITVSITIPTVFDHCLIKDSNQCYCINHYSNTLGSLLDKGLQSMPLYQSLFQHSWITAWWGFSINITVSITIPTVFDHCLIKDSNQCYCINHHSNTLGSLLDNGLQSMPLYQSLFQHWDHCLIMGFNQCHCINHYSNTLGSLLDKGLQSMPLYQSLFQHSGITAW